MLLPNSQDLCCFLRQAKEGTNLGFIHGNRVPESHRPELRSIVFVPATEGDGPASCADVCLASNVLIFRKLSACWLLDLGFRLLRPEESWIPISLLSSV